MGAILSCHRLMKNVLFLDCNSHTHHSKYGRQCLTLFTLKKIKKCGENGTISPIVLNHRTYKRNHFSDSFAAFCSLAATFSREIFSREYVHTYNNTISLHMYIHTYRYMYMIKRTFENRAFGPYDKIYLPVRTSLNNFKSPVMIRNHSSQNLCFPYVIILYIYNAIYIFSR